MSVDTLVFPNDVTPLDLLLYKTYGREIPGFVEATLKQNPGLAALGVFPPRGTTIQVTVPAPQAGPQRPVIKLYG